MCDPFCAVEQNQEIVIHTKFWKTVSNKQDFDIVGSLNKYVIIIKCKKTCLLRRSSYGWMDLDHQYNSVDQTNLNLVHKDTELAVAELYFFLILSHEQQKCFRVVSKHSQHHCFVVKSICDVLIPKCHEGWTTLEALKSLVT